MVGEAEARGLAKAELDREGDEVVLGPARELEQGWLFPVIAKKTRAFPSVIVNKRDGRVLHLLHDSPLERDPVLYDRGYQFDVYDLVVHGIDDLDATVRTLMTVHFVVREPYYTRTARCGESAVA